MVLCRLPRLVRAAFAAPDAVRNGLRVGNVVRGDRERAETWRRAAHCMARCVVVRMGTKLPFCPSTAHVPASTAKMHWSEICDGRGG